MADDMNGEDCDRCDGDEGDDREDSDAIDPAVLAVLAHLRDAANDGTGKPWSLAKLGKRAQMPMSTLRRTLTQLDAAGFTQTVLRDDGTGHAALTETGRALCDELFGGAARQ